MAYEHDGSLSRYIERVRSIPALSREEEHELAVKALAGDKAAEERLVEANLRFVVAVALQY
ncbi:MAG TPA: sigma-70 factor domain-containing protein, partial [Phycisphaerales bacterium]|nr:sigma-70 factor domain-containing protein [Phycisphaerales bacterium]